MSNDSGYTVVLQRSTKTGMYRAKIVLTSGEVYVVGDTAVTPFEAKINALSDARLRTWNDSDFKKLLDRIMYGTATEAELMG